MTKILSINGPEAECIDSADLVTMLRKMAEKQDKPITITEIQDKPQWIRTAAKWLMGLIGVGMLIGILISWVRP